ncbi:MAG TPA: superinfection immunity protein [Solirubrobacterales bacterium]|jgi:RsiW-degrading membrane proteinase PrsW (M82 family)
MGAILVIVVIGFYFLPTIVGAVRSVPNLGSVVVINFFLGWTFVGWVVALAMAFRSNAGATQVHIHQPSHQQSAADPELQDVIAKAIANHEEQKKTLDTPPD